MAETPAGAGSPCRTICLPITEELYAEIIADPKLFRQWLDRSFQQIPEVFPERFAQGYGMKDRRASGKQNLSIRRIELRDGTAWSIRPSFVTPGMSARTEEAAGPLFLRKFGVPFWALAHVFGRDPMFWYRLETMLGRNSIVGTTVRRAEIPEDLLADEHHQRRNGSKTYVATTVGTGCYLGAEISDSAGAEDLTAAYGVFRAEARNVSADYAPRSVNTDGWKSTQAAWKGLFPGIVLVACFLHAWLKIRDRGKHLGERFTELSRRVWEAYHAPNRRSFSQRIRALRTWAESRLEGAAREKTLDLCAKRELWAEAFRHPGAHRTSNMLDRMMRGMNRYFVSGQRLHGGREASRSRARGLALLWNFAPWSPRAIRANAGWRSPAERLNQHRYHDNWLQNMLVSASCGGYRSPQKA